MEALEIKSLKKIIEPEDKQPIKKGFIYLAPANYHLGVEFGYTFALSTEDPIHNSRPSIDLTMESSARVYKDKLVGIILTGANKDGALGMKKIKDLGGLTIAQDPEECAIETMPKAAMNATKIDRVMKADEIVEFLIEIDK